MKKDEGTKEVRGRGEWTGVSVFDNFLTISRKMPHSQELLVPRKNWSQQSGYEVEEGL